MGGFYRMTEQAASREDGDPSRKQITRRFPQLAPIPKLPTRLSAPIAAGAMFQTREDERMSDIVETCHRYAASVRGNGDLHCGPQMIALALEDAAAEIARLRAEKEELMEALSAHIEAAEKIRHWHDAMRDSSGMVVSADAVRELWDATESARAALSRARRTE